MKWSISTFAKMFVSFVVGFRKTMKADSARV